LLELAAGMGVIPDNYYLTWLPLLIVIEKDFGMTEGKKASIAKSVTYNTGLNALVPA
jgi:hypothetical protein